MKNSIDLAKEAATVEGAFVLQPPNRTKQSLQTVPVDLQPTVGVAITLRRENVSAEVGKESRSECSSRNQKIMDYSPHKQT